MSAGLQETQVIESSVSDEAEDHMPRLENTAQKYGLEGELDFEAEEYLDGGAVAATTKIPGITVEEVETYEDLKKHESAMVDADGNIYGVDRDDHIGYIADSEKIPELDPQTQEMVDVHELNHVDQYDDELLWGEVLDKEYDLSDEMRFQLNYVDQIIDVAEDPVLGNLINDAEVTALVEGYTQRVTEAMVEDGEEIGEDFYPGYTAVADYLMNEVYGTDPEEEFSK
ncbi:MAG: hypothetical protein ABEK10_02715 [Candidatus Nanosalina sp.]